jgi:Skp family chaperone for outer membrane proteins
MKIAFCVAVLAFQLAPVTAANAQTTAPNFLDIRLAVFSPERAFATSVVGKAAQARIGQAQAEKEKEINSRNLALEAQKRALAQSASVLGEAAATQRAKEIDKFQVDLQRFIQDAQAELTGFQRDVESEFLAKLTPALQQVAADRSLAMIFNEDSGLLAWAHPSLDVTADVVARLDLEPAK